MMLEPWKVVAPEPDNLECAEVSLTAWVRAVCRSDYAPHVRCNFMWFGAAGALTQVESEALAAWQRNEEVPPAVQPDNDASPASETWDSTFQSTSQPCKASCSFIRALAEMSLKVTVFFPSEEWTPGAEHLSPPASGGEGKKGKEAKGKGAAVAAVPETSAEVTLQLAPLIFAGCSGAHALEIKKDAKDGGLAKCSGIERLEIGARSDVKLLSDQVAEYLNPMMVTLESANKLPKEPHLGQKSDEVYAVFKAFGSHFHTPATRIGEKGRATFHHHKTYFVGPWQRRQLRDYLQTEKVTIEIHDRDEDPKKAMEALEAAEVAAARAEAALLAPKEPAPSPPSTGSKAKGKAAAKKAAAKAPAEKPGSAKVPSTADSAAAPPPLATAPSSSTAPALPPAAGAAFGMLRLSLADLVNPYLKHPLPFKGPLEPRAGLSLRRQKADPTSHRGGAQQQQQQHVIEPDAGAKKGAAPPAAVPEGEIAAAADKNEGEAKESSRAAQYFGESAKEILASLGKVTYDLVPGYRESDTSVSLEVVLSRPLRLPPDPAAALAAGEELSQEKLSGSVTEAAAAATAANLQQPSTDSDPSASVELSKGEDARYDRYGRLGLVLHYRKTTILRKLLVMVSSMNVAALDLSAGQARALSSVQLTEHQRKDPTLDIITGFVVMDKKTRILIVEGLRDKALQTIIQELNLEDIKSSKHCKVLYHPQLGFGQRLYTEFNLCLKQIKLRAPMLESLTSKPDLCLSQRCDSGVANALNQLVEIKRATRMNMIKASGSFPSAEGLVAIETQYGDFVADKELEGGCITDDGKSMSGQTKASSNAGSKESRPMTGRAPSVKPPQQKDLDEEEDSEDDAATIPDDEFLPEHSRFSCKPALDAANPNFDAMLKARAEAGPRNVIKTNVEALRTACQSARDGRLERAERWRDTTFLDGHEVHIYSGQKYNSAELQKKHLRATLMKDSKDLWTYSADKNSGCFPVDDDDVDGGGSLMRKTVKIQDYRPKWRLPAARSKEDFVKIDSNISPSRKEELTSPWIENQLYQEMQRGEIVPGAFDAKALSGQNVLPLRIPGLHDGFLPAPPTEPEPVKPMKFKGGVSAGMPHAVDKFKTGMSHGPPQARGVRFDERSPPVHLVKKYGQGPAVHNVEPAPVSFDLKEHWQEPPSTSNCMTSFMKAVGRPVTNKNCLTTATRPPPSGTPATIQPPPFCPTSVRPRGALTPRQSQVTKAMLAASRGMPAQGTLRIKEAPPSRHLPLAPLSAR